MGGRCRLEVLDVTRIHVGFSAWLPRDRSVYVHAREEVVHGIGWTGRGVGLGVWVGGGAGARGG